MNNTLNKETDGLFVRQIGWVVEWDVSIQYAEQESRKAFDAGRAMVAVKSVLHPGEITTEPRHKTFEDYLLHKQNKEQ